MTPRDVISGASQIPLDHLSLRDISPEAAWEIIRAIPDAGTAALLFSEAYLRPPKSASFAGAIESYERHILPPKSVHRGADEALLGICSILEWNLRHATVEISLILLPEHRTLPLAGEIIRGLTSFAFDALEANRAAIRCDDDDRFLRDAAVAAGFEGEGRLREHVCLGGRYRDIAIFAAVRGAWSPEGAEGPHGCSNSEGDGA